MFKIISKVKQKIYIIKITSKFMNKKSDFVIT